VFLYQAFQIQLGRRHWRCLVWSNQIISEYLAVLPHVSISYEEATADSRSLLPALIAALAPHHTDIEQKASKALSSISLREHAAGERCGGHGQQVADLLHALNMRHPGRRSRLHGLAESAMVQHEARLSNLTLVEWRKMTKNWQREADLVNRSLHSAAEAATTLPRKSAVSRHTKRRH
jgi:hypothetical protein